MPMAWVNSPGKRLNIRVVVSLMNAQRAGESKAKCDPAGPPNRPKRQSDSEIRRAGQTVLPSPPVGGRRRCLRYRRQDGEEGNTPDEKQHLQEFPDRIGLNKQLGKLDQNACVDEVVGGRLPGFVKVDEIQAENLPAAEGDGEEHVVLIALAAVDDVTLVQGEHPQPLHVTRE